MTFQNEDDDSKTEGPTDQKLRQALDDGDRPRSRELSTAATFLGAYAGMLALGLSGTANAVTRLGGLMAEVGSDWPSQNSASLNAFYLTQLQICAPVLGPIIIMGVAAAVLQGGGAVRLSALTLKASHVSPLSGLARIYGTRGLREFANVSCKCMVVGGGLFVGLYSQMELTVRAPPGDPLELARYLGRSGETLLWIAVLSSVIVAAVDYWLSWRAWLRRLRMSKQEVRREAKEAEGDPLVRSRIRAIGYGRARRRMFARVAEATVIITNPTHFAVALRFVRDETPAPVVVAKGKNLVALRIREIAAEHNVPVVENRPLARSLYDQVSVDERIPTIFYKAVAEVILYLSKRRRGRSGGVPL